jgi:hypothetical protein
MREMLKGFLARRRIWTALTATVAMGPMKGEVSSTTQMDIGAVVTQGKGKSGGGKGAGDWKGLSKGKGAGDWRRTRKREEQRQRRWRTRKRHDLLFMWKARTPCSRLLVEDLHKRTARKEQR